MANDAQRAEQLLPVVNEAAGAVSKRLFTFLTVSVYVAITVASTTDEMLLRGSLVKLPMLDTNIPISGLCGFYTIAPWLIVLLHSDLLMQLNLLATKLFRFQEAAAQLTDTERTRISERLASFHYVQFFLRDGVTGLARVVPGLVLFVGVVVLPLFVLCWTQLRFIALHDPVVTWSQRFALITDLGAILALLWPALARRDARRAAEGADADAVAIPALLSVRTAVAGMGVLVVAVTIAAGMPSKHPGEGFWAGLRRLNLRERVLTADQISAEAINALAEGSLDQREKQLTHVSRRSFLQGRNLSDANLYAAVLPRVDLRALRIGDTSVPTQLMRADLRWAHMQEVLLDDADLRHASLDNARIQGGSLVGADLRRANLVGAGLQDAKLHHAVLRGAILQGAQLQGADLSKADLRDADLSGANLSGAILRETRLERAILDGAVLSGADLSQAHLDDASLRRADLRGAALTAAITDGVRLEHATVGMTAAVVLADWTDTTDGTPVDHRQTALSAVHTQPGPDDREIAEYLRDLACADPYVARGLATQAVSKSDPSRAALARVLCETPLAGCGGLQELPAAAWDELRRAAKSPAGDGSVRAERAVPNDGTGTRG